MAGSKAELLEWLTHVADCSAVWIDDGGLTLQAYSETGDELYLELGGEPESFFPDDND